jgi:hypothetical protein
MKWTPLISTDFPEFLVMTNMTFIIIVEVLKAGYFRQILLRKKKKTQHLCWSLQTPGWKIMNDWSVRCMIIFMIVRCYSQFHFALAMPAVWWHFLEIAQYNVDVIRVNHRRETFTDKIAEEIHRETRRFPVHECSCQIRTWLIHYKYQSSGRFCFCLFVFFFIVSTKKLVFCTHRLKMWNQKTIWRRHLCHSIGLEFLYQKTPNHHPPPLKQTTMPEDNAFEQGVEIVKF